MKWRHCVFFREGNYLLKMVCQHHEFYMTEAPSHNIFKPLFISPQSSDPSARRSHQESWHRVCLMLFTCLSLLPTDHPETQPALKHCLGWDSSAASAPACHVSHWNAPPRRLFAIHRCEQRFGRSSRASYLLLGLWRSQISKPRQGQCWGHRYTSKTRQAADQTCLPMILHLVQNSVDDCGVILGNECSESPDFTVNEMHSILNWLWKISWVED